MSNISLIIAHEYKTRVLKKSFIIATILTPLIMILLMLIPTWLMTRSDDTHKDIVIVDQTGLYHNTFINDDNYTFFYLNTTLEDARQKHHHPTAIMLITQDLSRNDVPVMLYADKQLNSETISHLRQILNKAVRQQKIDASGIPNLQDIISELHTDIQITSITVSEEGKERVSSADFAELTGMIAALLIYMFIVMYGSMVLQGVVQEKSNRIMEVMLSSTRPFDLMMGKIIGVALVGLTQVFLWVLIIGIAAALIMPSLMSKYGIDTSEAMLAAETIQQQGFLTDMLTAISNFNFTRLIALFIIYFIGGYLLYSSLFAACGSAVDNETDTQQFTMPITLIILIALYAGIYAAQHPDTSATFWFSMIPFTSPLVMLVRLAYDVQWWELALSIALLVATFILTTWLAAKVYRVGVLMYGKKPSWKEIIRWIRY